MCEKSPSRSLGLVMIGVFGQGPINDFMISKVATGAMRARMYGARFVVAMLMRLTQCEEGLRTTRGESFPGNRQDFFKAQERSRDVCRGAVATLVSTEFGQWNEDSGRVGHHVAVSRSRLFKCADRQFLEWDFQKLRSSHSASKSVKPDETDTPLQTRRSVATGIVVARASCTSSSAR